MKKSKFLGKVLTGLGCLTLIGGAGLGITYLVNPGLVQGWFGQAQEKPDNPTPDKPTPPEEYGEEIKDFQFSGSYIEHYTGADVVLNKIPTSYDIKVGDIKDEMIFNSLDEFEQQEHEFFERSNNKAYYVTPNGYERTLCKTEAEWQAFSEVFASTEESLQKAFPLKFEFAERTFVKGDAYKVSQIGTSAFRGNTILMEITIPTEIKEIHNHAFKDCTNLQKVVLNESITKLSNDVFSGCTSLEQINLDNITEYQRDCLSGTKIKELNITSGNIMSLAFTNMLELKSVTIADGVKIISDAENSLFDNCPNLENVTINSSTLEPGIIVNLFKNGFGEKNKVYVPDDYFAQYYEMFKAYPNSIYPINGVYPTPSNPVEETKLVFNKEELPIKYLDNALQFHFTDRVLDLTRKESEVLGYVDTEITSFDEANSLEEYTQIRNNVQSLYPDKVVKIESSTIYDYKNIATGSVSTMIEDIANYGEWVTYPVKVTVMERHFYKITANRVNSLDNSVVETNVPITWDEVGVNYNWNIQQFDYESLNLNSFVNCENLETLIVDRAYFTDWNISWYTNSSIKNIVLLNTDVANLGHSGGGELDVTPFVEKNIQFYVLDGLYEQYLTHENWSKLASQIHRISEYQGELNIKL